ncbi:MAG: sigma-54-dependent Fis family transcriptional regulator [Nitrospirae bacterium]|nr:sigma-54-dependent Fis family transcriptional regulator [Nitrospirota bacterium]
MAGSPFTSDIPLPFGDPILAARVEAIKQLAQGLTERVAVLDRDRNVIYANEAAWTESAPSPDHARPAKCYEAFVQRQDPCGACPALKVFESPGVSCVSCSTGGDGTACGMYQAFPLVTSQGDTGLVLVLFKGRGGPLTGTTSTVSQTPSESYDTHLGALIGRSPVMRQLFEMIRLVADSEATVLIQGESGTGKELVARTIHQLSGRSEHSFVVVDCGSLPESLLESELFGHVRGAFTGAVTTRKGLFEEADGGTIFLDEIADTSPAFQAKLLRVLQEGEIKPVGSSRGSKVDVRVISATNKDLADLVKTKGFRQDLYYRLAVLPLYLPPLRDRREDIPLLIDQFVAASCTRHRQPLRLVSPEVRHALTDSPWPGNVRELQHYIERAVVTTTGPELARSNLVALGPAPALTDLKSVARGAAGQAERLGILEALRQTEGNRAKAAKLLKISRASLYNKLRSYRIDTI